GIGEATLAKLGDVARQAQASLFAAVFEPAFAAVAQARAREELERFCALVNGIRHRAVKEPAGRLLTELVRGIGYDDYLVATFEREDAKARAKSVQDFVDWLARKGESDGKSLLELTQKGKAAGNPPPELPRMTAPAPWLEGRAGGAPAAVHLSTLPAARASSS